MPAAQLAQGQRVVGVAALAGVVYALHQRMALQEIDHGQRVAAGALLAQAQRLQALQQQEGAVRRQRRAAVAQQHGTGPRDEGAVGKFLGEDKALVGRLGRAELRVAPRVRHPVEAAAVHNQPAQHIAVSADGLGGRMHDDVGAPVEGPQQQRRSHGVVHHQGHAGRMADIGQLAQVGNAARWIAHGLHEHGLGARPYRPAQRLEIILGHGRALHAARGQHMGDEVVRAAIQLRGHDHMVARTGQRGQRHVDGGHARGQGQRGHAAFECRNALLQHRQRGVGRARVHIALLHQAEQVGAVLGAVEHEGGALVDGHGRAALLLSPPVAGVQGLGVLLPQRIAGCVVRGGLGAGR